VATEAHEKKGETPDAIFGTLVDKILPEEPEVSVV
jgi:hypothetical protein